jgi:flagellar basal body rod protein FlgC
MPSFSIPLSGLTANSSALSTTANNLANLNTIGYPAYRFRLQPGFGRASYLPRIHGTSSGKILYRLD